MTALELALVAVVVVFGFCCTLVLLMAVALAKHADEDSERQFEELERIWRLPARDPARGRW